jgi:flagellar protein FlaG
MKVASFTYTQLEPRAAKPSQNQTAPAASSQAQTQSSESTDSFVQTSASHIETNHKPQQTEGNNEGKLQELLHAKNQEQQERLEELKEQANAIVQKFNVQLNFNVDDKLETLIVEVRNQKSGELVRQIPPEHMVHIAKQRQDINGLLVDKWS